MVITIPTDSSVVAERTLTGKDVSCGMHNAVGMESANKPLREL
jgi:hypothetical protein